MTPSGSEIKLILLDFDGTLADTRRANTLAYVATLGEAGYTLTEQEYAAKYFGMRCNEFLTQFGIADPAERERLRLRKIALYPTFFDTVRLNRPLWEFCRQFRAQGGRVWIVSTGSRANIDNVMRHLGITVAGQRRGKPDPAGLTGADGSGTGKTYVNRVGAGNAGRDGIVSPEGVAAVGNRGTSGQEATSTCGTAGTPTGQTDCTAGFSLTGGLPPEHAAGTAATTDDVQDSRYPTDELHGKPDSVPCGCSAQAEGANGAVDGILSGADVAHGKSACVPCGCPAQAEGANGAVDGILSGADVAHGKPAPDCFLEAMRREGCTPRETLIFEDSEIGLEAARRSGASYFKVKL